MLSSTLLDEADDPHVAGALGADQRIDFIDSLGDLRGRRRSRQTALAPSAPILRHLGLWHVPARKRAPPPTPAEIILDYSVADEPASYD